MYTFDDKGGRSCTLRPEGTASVVRAYLEHKISNLEDVTRWYYHGPMFRYERPQAGRYREFNQIGVEVLGKKDATLEKILNDSKIIAKAVNKARNMVNTAPADFYPEVMANIAQDLAKAVEISCEVYGEKYLEKNNMMAMHSVGRASIHESKPQQFQTMNPDKWYHSHHCYGAACTHHPSP